VTALGELLVDSQPGFACGREDADGVFQFRMNNVTSESGLDLSKRRRVPPDAHKKIGNFLVKRDDILFNATNSPENVGKSVLVPELDEQAVFSNHFIRLRTDRARLFPAYLWRWLQWNFGRGIFNAMCRQWVNQATVSREALLELHVPLPPLDEQRRIAAILDQADLLRRRCERASRSLDELNRSAYFHAFGNPLHGSGNRQRLGDVCQVITGNTPSRSDPDNYDGEIEWIKSDNLGATYATEAEERLSRIGKERSRVAPAGSVLVTCIAGSPASIGKCSLVDREVAFNQQINAAVPGPDIDGRFLLEQLKVAPELVRGQSTGGMKGLVSKTSFMSIEIHVPPLKQQRNFVNLTKEVDELRGERATVSTEINALISSLQSRAFSGKL